MAIADRTMRAAMRIVAYGTLFLAVTCCTIFWTRFTGGLAFVWLGTAIASALFLVLPRAQHFRAAAFLTMMSTVATSLFGFGPVW
ncbi:MAG TPA: hypothetical protein DCF81_03955, partial [Erythrobacter sp.]|nr:hypothetical protein [Erythrobacter sp.]